MSGLPKHILVVDDEENTRIGLSRLLRQEGFIVELAGNGLEALEVLKRQRISLVITDINMPDMNGMSFLRELHRVYPSVGVIMITAFGGVESYMEAMDLGAIEYLHKPLRYDDLRTVMKKVFDRGEAVLS